MAVENFNPTFCWFGRPTYWHQECRQVHSKCLWIRRRRRTTHCLFFLIFVAWDVPWDPFVGIDWIAFRYGRHPLRHPIELSSTMPQSLSSPSRVLLEDVFGPVPNFLVNIPQPWIAMVMILMPKLSTKRQRRLKKSSSCFCFHGLLATDFFNLVNEQGKQLEGCWKWEFCPRKIRENPIICSSLILKVQFLHKKIRCIISCKFSPRITKISQPKNGKANWFFTPREKIALHTIILNSRFSSFICPQLDASNNHLDGVGIHVTVLPAVKACSY